MSIHVARWSSLFNPKGETVSTTWPAWWAELRDAAPEPPPDHIRADPKGKLKKWKEKRLAGWSPGWFEPAERGEETIRELYAIGADLETVPLDEAAATWGWYAGAIHTTVSHCAERPALRLMLVLSRAVSAAEYRDIVAGWLLPQLPPLAAAAVKQAKDPARLWYVPCSDAEWRELGGAPLDVDKVLEKARAALAESAAKTSKPTKPAAQKPAAQKPADQGSSASSKRATSPLAARCLAWARAAVQATGRRLARVPDGSKHTEAVKEGYTLGGLLHVGLDLDAVADEVLDALRAGGWNVTGQGPTAKALRDSLRDGAMRPIDVEARLRDEDERAAVADEEHAPAEDVQLAEGTDPYTDLANAERLVGWHGHDLRWVVEWDTWLVWDGKQWARDNAAAERRAKETVRRMAIQAADEFASGGGRLKGGRGRRAASLAEWAVKSQSNGAIAAMLKLAKGEASIQARALDFDADQWTLPCLNGVVDLRTGELRPHRRSDMCSRLAPVNYDPEARSAVWERYLATVTLGSEELATFLRRAVGYSISGSAREDRHFIVHNKLGGTGKSTFTATLRASLGPLAGVANSDTFLESRMGRSPSGPSPDIAELAGVRLVISSEIPEGRKIDESLFKALTGGEPVKARRLQEQLVEFVPRFKLWITCNDLPRVSAGDDGFWRRVYRIKLGRKLAEHEKDKSMRETLTNPAISGAAVLAWAVRGCLEWQEQGLAPPPEVQDATAEYRAQQDPLLGFLEAYVVPGGCLDEAGAVVVAQRDHLRREGAWVNQAELRKAYVAWAEAEGKHALGAVKYGEHLRALGCVPHTVKARGDGGVFKVWIGIRAKTPAERAAEAADPLDS